MKQRIVAVHLLNDYSGSPKVLMQLLKCWTAQQQEVHLFTSKGKAGFLTAIPNVVEHSFWYQFFANTLIRLLSLMFSQLILCCKLLLFLKKNDVLYVNTVLPFAAGIAGKIKGCTVIYHIHETSVKPALLKKFLFGIARWSAKEMVYVSSFLSKQEPFDGPSTIMYNVLEEEFVQRANNNIIERKAAKVVLMICSLKAYKGVNEFVQLALLNEQFQFKLVVNAHQDAIRSYFDGQSLPGNLTIYPTQKDTHKFYEEASIVLNLSDVKLWVETFGLTILEAMAYGLPVIVPPVGGITELVEDGINGFLIDSKNLLLLSTKINELLTDEQLYHFISTQNRIRSKQFNPKKFEQQALDLLTPKSTEKAKKSRVAIIGTVGLPAQYGGFETLAEHLVSNLSDKHDFTVYCSAKKYPKAGRPKSYKGARLAYIGLQANGVQSIPYDSLSIIRALFHHDVLLVLGVAGAWILPFVKLLTKKKIIVSIDGIEWKRDKWPLVAKMYLWWAEKIAMKFSHIDISDNESIQDYTALRYETLSRVIEYGADHTLVVNPTEEDRIKYPFLNAAYAVKVCRIEPENNAHLVLEAFASLPKQILVFVGNWRNSEYGRLLKTKYKACPNIHLFDPIYNQREIDVLRGNAALYIHGHSAGGTNPSLVEAMYLGLPILSFDVTYNRTTTENKAVYFANAEQLREAIESLSLQGLGSIGAAMKSIAQRRYTWKRISDKYEQLIQEALGADKKTSVYPELNMLNTSVFEHFNLSHLKNSNWFYEKR